MQSAEKTECCLDFVCSSFSPYFRPVDVPQNTRLDGGEGFEDVEEADAKDGQEQGYNLTTAF